MKTFAQTRGKIDATLTTTYVLPMMLAANTCALLALEQLGGIPNWVKTAAALFLSF